MREKYLNFLARNRETITKFLSVIIAIMLWFFIITEIDPVISKDFNNVEVELRNQTKMRDSGMELLKHDVYTTNIVVSGNRSAIFGLKKEDISAYVDLGDVQPGSQRLPIHVLLSDESLKIERTNPVAITVAVDEMVTAKKPVTITTQGQPGDGMVLDRITVNQEEVTVKGPKEDVDKLHSISGVLNVKGATEAVVASVELTPLDQEKNPIKGLEITPNAVGVQATISKAKSVPIEIKYEENAVENFKQERAILTPSSVTITGDTDAIDKIESIQTKPIDSSELMNVFTMPVEIIVPDGVHLVNPDEPIILRYMKNETARRVLTISSEGLTPETGVDIDDFELPKKVDVEVYGDQNLIDAIRGEDLTLLIDKDGKIKAKGPKELEIIRITPKRLSSSS